MNSFQTLKSALQTARALLVKLQKRIDKDPTKFCENYGQNEIRDFESRLNNLHYTEQCKVMDILYSVADMVPNVSNFEFDENGDNVIK